MSCCKRIFLLFALIFAVLSLSAAGLPAAFTKAGNPSLYKELHSLAKENLKRLRNGQGKAYRRLLNRYPDVVMAYLLAYESDANLQCAAPADVASNYREIVKLLAERGCEHSPEFFLSYVADQTVSDERIEAYRAALLDDGLRQIMRDSADELELYRKVSQWCVSKLKFQQTSGRDQTPLDITRKSIVGRCEEMQILFVAAARTVGLPSRPASTPWWAHMDNNHAWAEVWLDNAWHYTGDMDAAYYPDQTWFSGMIDKTVLILADGSLPSEQDEVLSRGRYDCVINSVRNYAGERTRTIRIRTLDAQGNPLGKVPVRVMVYNWYSLRVLAEFATAEDGSFTLSTGRGGFYLCASLDGRQALVPVPSTEQNELDVNLVLNEGPLPPQDMFLEYPSNPFTWKQAPPEWDLGVKEAKALWDGQDSSFTERGAACADTLQGKVLSACRGNHAAWESFLKMQPEPGPDFLNHLLESDPKFLWQADAAQFAALYQNFQRFDAGQLNPEEQSSLLSPSVFYEELPRPFGKPDSPRLYPASFIKAGNNDLERLHNAMRWLKKKHRIDPAKALRGLLPLEEASRSKYLSNYQYCSLAVSLARANGIPAEFTRIPDLIYVLVNDQWRYYNLRLCEFEDGGKKDSASSFTLRVRTLDEQGVPLDIDPKNLSLARWQNGLLYPLNHKFTATGGGTATANLPRGEYYLQAGYRVSDARTAYQLQHLTVESELSLDLVLREFPRKWEELPEDSELRPLLAEAGDCDCLLIGNFDRENSLRLAEKLNAEGVVFLWLGYEEAAAAPANYRVSPAWQALVAADQINSVRSLTLLRKDGVWQYHQGIWEKLPR